MLRYKFFCEDVESKRWIWQPHDYDISHWSDQRRVTVFHGTHENNIPGILKNGITNADPKTGKISVAIGNHGGNVAHGYAAMSGEHAFRQAGAKAIQVPPENRAVVVADLPKHWVDKHVDRSFGGNTESIKRRLGSRNIHMMHVHKNAEAFGPHETPELRFSKPIPAKYIKGWMKKDRPNENI